MKNLFITVILSLLMLMNTIHAQENKAANICNKVNKNYAKALKAAKMKMKMIADGSHPFYWAAFVVSGL